MARMPSQLQVKVPQGRLTGSIVGGKYRLDDVIAEGGMGVIYRAWHLVLDQPVVVKVMRLELLDRPEASVRFLNEARTAACLRGSHIARIFDSGAIGLDGKKVPYIVLEYLEGADLRTVLERHGALSLDQSVDFIVQACEALAEAHLSGIVHRDVKPENLFLTTQADGSAVIKLLDFGIAKRVGADPLRERVGTHSLGSPHYMAPEQMYLPHGVDARADVWSLGVVLYELLTLRVPFEGNSLAGVYASVVRQEPTAPSRYRTDLPVAIDEAILGCLTKPKRQRTSSVRDLALALAPYGSSRAHESLRRIQRLFERRADTPAAIEVDVENFDRDAPWLESDPIRKKRRIPFRQVGFVAFTLTVLAVALPSHQTIAEISVKSWRALSPLGARLRGIAGYPPRKFLRETRRADPPLSAMTVPVVGEPSAAESELPGVTLEEPNLAVASVQAAPSREPLVNEASNALSKNEEDCFWNRALAPWAPLTETEADTRRNPATQPSNHLLWPEELGKSREPK